MTASFSGAARLDGWESGLPRGCFSYPGERVYLKNKTKEWAAQESKTGLMHPLSSWLQPCLKPGAPDL